jgi:hypothetical protein
MCSPSFARSHSLTRAQDDARLQRHARKVSLKRYRGIDRRRFFLLLSLFQGRAVAIAPDLQRHVRPAAFRITLQVEEGRRCGVGGGTSGGASKVASFVATENERRPRCFRAWPFSPAMPPVWLWKVVFVDRELHQKAWSIACPVWTGSSQGTREELVQVSRRVVVDGSR